MSSLARLIEETVVLDETAPSDPISLNWAAKYSIEATATTGDSTVNLEVSNVDEPGDSDWTQIDTFDIAEGESDMFEQPSPENRWARIVVAGSSVVVTCMVLVIGDAM